MFKFAIKLVNLESLINLSKPKSLNIMIMSWSSVKAEANKSKGKTASKSMKN